MNKEILFRSIGNVDEELLARCPLPENQAEPLSCEKNAAKKHRSPIRPMPKPARILCASLCLVFTAAALLLFRLLPGGSGKENFPLSEASRGVTVSRIDHLPDPLPASTADLPWLEEEELFTNIETHIFEGTVTGIQNIVMDFSGEPEYRAIASIEIERVFRGDCAPGDTVQVLLPCPVGDHDVWVEDTGVISRLRTGMRGIFMPQVYDAGSIREQNGARLLLSDLAPYGLPDGERYAFLETKDGPVFDRASYESLREASSMAEVAAYIEEMLKTIR